MPDGEPSQEELRALHEGLVDGRDPTTQARLAAVLLPALQRRFASRTDLDRDDIASLIGESITKYLTAPHRYDPDRSPLLAYLYQDVDGDIRNEAAKRRRRPEEAAGDEVLEHRSRDRKPTPEDEALDRVDPLDLPPDVIEAARRALARFTPEEREVLRLHAEGVRSTQVYAEVLGIAHLPDDDKRREVKRVKDRVSKRLESIRDRLDG